MRILWLSHLIPYPPKGGVLQRAYNLLREVSKYHEIDLLAFHQPDLMSPLVSDLEEGIHESRKVLSGFCENVEFKDIESDRRPWGNYTLAFKSLTTKDPYNINWLKSRKYADALQTMLETNEYDLVHLDTISLIPYLDYVKHLPTVLDHHNIESHMLLRRAENEKNILKKWYFHQEGVRLERIEKRVCPQVSLNITCSDIDRKRLKQISPQSQVEEVPNGVDIDYFRPDESIQQVNNLIFIGTLNWYPNVEAVRFIAYDLWPELIKDVPDIVIDVIGAEPPDDIVHLSKKDKNFNVHGFVEDIMPFMNKASIYICPIMDGGGTKLKVLDALSMGKALVAHEIACEGIHVENHRNVIFANTVAEYVEAIKRLLEDDGLRLAMGKAARKLVEEEYAYTKIGQKLSQLYLQCADSKEKNALKEKRI